MTYGLSFLLGLVQGVAEFLPISSSGHLSLLQYYFGMEEADSLLNILLHFATLLAVCVCYRQDIYEMLQECVRGLTDLYTPKGRHQTTMPTQRRMVILLILGTLPLVLVLPISDWVEGLGSNPYFVSCALLVTGTLLFTADRQGHGRKNGDTISYREVLLIGLAQGFATIPGLSRSGCTISAALALGVERTFAVRYSFLLSLPAVAGATLLKILDILEEGWDSSLLPVYLVGMAEAFVVGIFSIHLVKLLAKQGKFGAFSYYCWTVGLLSLLRLFLG